mmetsp:Transcript_24298/g.63769  ORF Transcript_24298/g.63769 Transcript_24298/m.63769 type:complete len:224 (+) Transcript_24298:1314-1985(+)
MSKRPEYLRTPANALIPFSFLTWFDWSMQSLSTKAITGLRRRRLRIRCHSMKTNAKVQGGSSTTRQSCRKAWVSPPITSAVRPRTGHGNSPGKERGTTEQRRATSTLDHNAALELKMKQRARNFWSRCVCQSWEMKTCRCSTRRERSQSATLLRKSQIQPHPARTWSRRTALTNSGCTSLNMLLLTLRLSILHKEVRVLQDHTLPRMGVTLCGRLERGTTSPT